MSPPMVNYDARGPTTGPPPPVPPPYLVAYPVGSIPLGSPINDTMQREASPFEKLSETNLYIRGLSADTTDLDLQKMCEKFGTIVSTKAIIDNETNKYWIDDKALREMLEPYGDVVSTRILRHQSTNQSEGKSKGVGFARMHLKEQCEKIIEKFNGQPLTDPNDPAKATVKPLLVKFADGGPKKKKNHQLNISTQWTARRDEMMETGLPLVPFPMVPAYPANMSMASYPPYQTSFPPTTSFAHMPSVALPGNMADFAAQNQFGYPIPVIQPGYQMHPQQMEQEQQQAPTEQQTGAATGSGAQAQSQMAQMQPQQPGGATAQNQTQAGGQNQREMVQVPQFQPVYYGVA